MNDNKRELKMEEPNPPKWSAGVKLFHPGQKNDEILSSIKETQDPYNVEFGCYTTARHFSKKRWALLFAPGIYQGLSFEVGYYTQVAGLGQSPNDVVFANCDKGPFVEALDKHVHQPHGLSLDTFWRSAENFATEPALGMKWAVSQAAPLRRVHVKGDLHLHDGAAYASGGHIANCEIDGHTYFGGQQQYMCRNVDFGDGHTGGAWSLVFTGCSGADVKQCDGAQDVGAAITVSTPLARIEKPYIALQEDGQKFELRVPKATRDPSKIHSAMGTEETDSRDFKGVCVIIESDENATTRIQRALDNGMDVVFSPGVYQLDRTIEIKQSDTVLLGLGLATLVNPSDGTPCIRVFPRLEGVRIAGLMLEAADLEEDAGGTNVSDREDSSLLEWGSSNVRDPGNPDNPGSMFDIFCRVGGSSGNREAVSVNTMIKIYSGNVIGDHLWLWRADHAELGKSEKANYPDISPVFWQCEETEARVQTGLEVYGDDVTIFGLAVEHTLADQVVWKGQRGEVHFYQCELPYDVDAKYASSEYRGYRISDNVDEHTLYAPGIYSNFRNHAVSVSTAIEHPSKDGIRIVNPFTVHLNNHGTIQSIVNGEGNSAEKQGQVTRLSVEPSSSFLQ